MRCVARVVARSGRVASSRVARWRRRSVVARPSALGRATRTTTRMTTTTTTTGSAPAGFSRRVKRALGVRLSDVVGTTTTTRDGEDDAGGDGDEGDGEGGTTRARSVDLATCARALSEILPLGAHGATTSSVNLRATVERRGLALNERFLDESMRARTKLSQVEATLEALDGARERMRTALETSKQKTSSLLRETARAKEELSVIESRRELVNSFAVDFQLTKAHVDALTTVENASGENTEGASTAATAAPTLPSVFFQALERVKVIQGNCAKLANTDQQRAGLELMDVMTSYMETAHEKMRRWVVAKCRLLAEEDDFVTEGDERALRKAMSALRLRPTLFKACVEEVTRTRHNALFRRFITALTRGGAGTKPIEVHAHDPLRYAGDMLSWVHQAVAGEKEFCGVIFTDEAIEGDQDAFDPSKEMLSKVFDAICRPLKVRVEQILASASALEGGVMTAYKLANLLPFYRNLLGELLERDATITKTVSDLCESAKTSFADAVAQHGAKYRKLSLAPNALAGEDAFSPPAVLREGVASAIELLESVATSSSTASGSDAEARELLALGVNGVIDPIVGAVEAAASRATEQARSVIGSSGPKWSGHAFALNCLHAIREPLRSHAVAAAKVDELSRAIAKRVSDVADGEAGTLLASCGLNDALELVVLYQEQHGAGDSVMAKDPALQIDKLASALSTLVDSAGTNAPEFNEIQAPSMRGDVVSRYNDKLIEAYTRVYAAILNPSSGYGSDARSKVRHGPAALSTVLG